MGDQKRCSGCRMEKSYAEYNKNKSRPDGYEQYCRECKEYLRKKFVDPEKENARFRKSYWKNVGMAREKKRKKYRRNRHSLATRFRDYKKSARNKGLTFTLTKESFSRITSLACFYCGGYSCDKLKFTGADRIDNTKGYTESNVVPCCKRCNYGRNRMTQTEYMEHIRKAYLHLWG